MYGQRRERDRERYIHNPARAHVPNLSQARVLSSGPTACQPASLQARKPASPPESPPARPQACRRPGLGARGTGTAGPRRRLQALRRGNANGMSYDKPCGEM